MLLLHSLILDPHVTDELLRRIEDPTPSVEHWTGSDQYKFEAAELIQSHYMACEEKSCMPIIRYNEKHIKSLLLEFNHTAHGFFKQFHKFPSLPFDEYSLNIKNILEHKRDFIVDKSILSYEFLKRLWMFRRYSYLIAIKNADYKFDVYRETFSKPDQLKRLYHDYFSSTKKYTIENKYLPDPPAFEYVEPAAEEIEAVVDRGHIEFVEILAYLDDPKNIKDINGFFDHMNQCRKCFIQFNKLAAPTEELDDFEVQDASENVKTHLKEKLGLFDNIEIPTKGEVPGVEFPLGGPGPQMPPISPSLSTTLRLSTTDDSFFSRISVANVSAVILSLVFLLSLWDPLAPGPWVIKPVQKGLLFRGDAILQEKYHVNMNMIDDTLSFSSNYPDKSLTIRSSDGEEYYTNSFDEESGSISLVEELSKHRISKKDTLEIDLSAKGIVVYRGKLFRSK